MSRDHRVAQGEGISSIAFLYGFFPDTIWEDDANEDLRKIREDPDVLLPGDIVVIPERIPKTIAVATDKRHSFKRKGVPAVFEIQIFGGDQPRANETYLLEVDGVEMRGSTDADGNLRVWISPAARRGELYVGEDRQHFSIEFGELDPITEIVGIQKRLSNIGYVITDPPNEYGSSTRTAMMAFQRRFDLEITGERDRETIAKLLAVHDDIAQFPDPSADSG